MESRNPIKRLVQRIMHDGIEAFGRHYSCYRGFVVYNTDPKKMDRLFVRVPHISGNKQEGNWAWPKGKPHTNREIPKIGDMVWVEFERGDFRFPVWSFCNQTKKLLNEEEEYEGADERKRYGSEGGHSMEMDDYNDHIRMFHNQGSEVKIEKDRIDIKHKSGSEIEIYEDHIIITEKSGSKIVLKEGKIILNGGNNEGLIKISRLVDRIQRLENNMNNHVHLTAAGNTSPIATPLTPLTSVNFLENPDVKH